MKKLACLLLAIGMVSGMLAACETEEAVESASSSPEVSSSVEESSPEESIPEKTPPKTLTKEEWDALADVDLYTNVTVITTQIDSYFKTVGETRIVDGYIYGVSTFYNVETGEVEGMNPWYKMQIVSESMMFAPDLEDYAKIAHNVEDDVYYYVGEKVEVIEDEEWHFTKMEWRVRDGKLVETYFEFWYMDEYNGTAKKVTGSSKTEHYSYGTTVAPEGV